MIWVGTAYREDESEYVNIIDLNKAKRNRSFQVKWSDEFLWVNYENEKMLCTLCVKFSDLSDLKAVRIDFFYYTPAPRRGSRVYCFTSVLPSVQDIFRRIFLCNYWWQKSDIWSQASYRYTILWVAFLDRQIPTSCLPT